MPKYQWQRKTVPSANDDLFGPIDVRRVEVRSRREPLPLVDLVVIIDEQEHELTIPFSPAQARAMAASLLELADDAEASSQPAH